MTCNRCGRPPWQHLTDYQNRLSCIYPPKFMPLSLNPAFLPPLAAQNPTALLQDASQYSCPPQVLRRRLKKSNKHTNADVLMNYGHQCANFSESKMRVMCLKLDEERQEIRTWATNEVKMRMLKSAIMCGMRFGPEMSIVRHFNDIYTSWTEDSSDTNARRMYSVLYGNFEGKNANWSQVLEGEFMSRMGREYLPELNEGKVKTMGCYEKQISGCKSTQVKLLNRTDAGGERGKCIQMSYPGKNKGVENSRRKAGDFFVKDLKTVSKDLKHGRIRLYEPLFLTNDV